MALWGRIIVNDQILGDWEARRLTRLTTPVDEHDYEWAVTVRGERAEGRLSHRYSDGSVALAAKVLALAAEQGVGAL